VFYDNSAKKKKILGIKIMRLENTTCIFWFLVASDNELKSTDSPYQSLVCQSDNECATLLKNSMGPPRIKEQLHSDTRSCRVAIKSLHLTPYVPQSTNLQKNHVTPSTEESLRDVKFRTDILEIKQTEDSATKQQPIHGAKIRSKERAMVQSTDEECIESAHGTTTEKECGKPARNSDFRSVQQHTAEISSTIAAQPTAEVSLTQSSENYSSRRSDDSALPCQCHSSSRRREKGAAIFRICRDITTMTLSRISMGTSFCQDVSNFNVIYYVIA